MLYDWIILTELHSDKDQHAELRPKRAEYSLSLHTCYFLIVFFHLKKNIKLLTKMAKEQFL